LEGMVPQEKQPGLEAEVDFADVWLALVRATLEAELAPENRRRTEAAAALRPAARHGTLLRRTVIRHDWDEALLAPVPDGPLLLTPVADYLLTPAPDSATQEERAAGLRALHDWDALC
ncbi:hypothetical protein ACWC5I_34995, partial [Kitasatospora sp. NPDC001574]